MVNNFKYYFVDLSLTVVVFSCIVAMVHTLLYIEQIDEKMN